jgi:hypothetical protein
MECTYRRRRRNSIVHPLQWMVGQLCQIDIHPPSTIHNFNILLLAITIPPFLSFQGQPFTPPAQPITTLLQTSSAKTHCYAKLSILPENISYPHWIHLPRPETPTSTCFILPFVGVILNLGWTKNTQNRFVA